MSFGPPGADDPHFQEIAGHPRVKRILATQLASGQVAQAYLFTGEAGLGKTAVGRRLAGALLPQARLSIHPDYWEDDRLGPISIDEIRLLPDRQPEFHLQPLKAFLSLRPALGERRVALISSVGRLKDEVQAILLKTLEEPHSGQVIILTSPSASPFVVLPTIVSRCQRIDFHPLADKEVEQLLLKRGVEPERAQELALLARGRPGWALAAAQDPHLPEQRRLWEDRLREVLVGDRGVALGLAQELDRANFAWRAGPRTEEDPILVAVASWQLHLRRRMLEGVGARRWAVLLERSFELLGHHEQNVSPRLALECFLLEARTT